MAANPDPDQFTTPFLLTKTSHRDPYPAISPEKPENSKKGKIIIITGASAGIGAAAAKVWARAGASGIVIAARRLPQLEDLAKEIKSISPDTKVLPVKADIQSEEDVRNLYAEAKKTFGRPVDVVVNNAGYLQDEQLIGETPVSEWWKTLEINLKGLYLMSHHYIQSQPNPKDPTGTLITVSSGRAGLTAPGASGYNISKLAEQRLNEHLQVEYPNLRVFTTMPGIVNTAMAEGNDFWVPFAKDHVDLTGMLALYLTQPRADYLKGGMIGVNWDVDEMEAHKDEIISKKLLETSWLPVLPFGGGKGLGA